MEKLEHVSTKFSKSLSALNRNLDFFSKQTRALDPVEEENRVAGTIKQNATTHDYDEESAQETSKRIADYYKILKSVETKLCFQSKDPL